LQAKLVKDCKNLQIISFFIEIKKNEFATQYITLIKSNE